MKNPNHIKLRVEEMERMSQNEYANSQKLPIVLVLDNIRSMHNIGAAFRCADAFLAAKIVLCGISATPPRKEIAKTALGAENHVAWEYHPCAIEAAETLKKDGFTLIGIEQVTKSIELSKVKVAPNNKYALVFGHEVTGVSQEVLDMCELCCEIDQLGVKHSLNVSVAIGIASWHFARLLQ